MKSLHSSRLLQSKRYEFCGTISANPCPFRKTAAALKILCSHNQETGIKCEPVHVILSSPQGDAPMRPIQAYVPKERILPSREIVKEGHVPMGREGSNGHALSGVRVDGPSGRRFLRGLSLTAAMPLRVVEGASKFIEGASLYKTFTTALRAREMHSPFGGWRHHLPAPLGSVSLDSQSSTTPCGSSSLATAERWDNKAPQSNPFISRSQHNEAL